MCSKAKCKIMADCPCLQVSVEQADLISAAVCTDADQSCLPNTTNSAAAWLRAYMFGFANYSGSEKSSGTSCQKTAVSAVPSEWETASFSSDESNKICEPVSLFRMQHPSAFEKQQHLCVAVQTR